MGIGGIRENRELCFNIYGKKPKYVPLIWEEGIRISLSGTGRRDIGVMDDNKSIGSVCLMPFVGDSYILNNSLRMYVFNGMKLRKMYILVV